MKWRLRLPWRKQVADASYWFERVRSGRIDERLDREYMAWLASNAQHEDDYAARELAWELTGELQGRETVDALLRDVDRFLAQNADERLPAAARRTSFARRRRWAVVALPLGAAAAAALAIFVVLRPTTVEYRTGVGEQRTVALSDRSTILLNTATTLRVVYSRSRRLVNLEQGEAIFSVMHGDTRPFDVIALDGVTRAVGTQFDVQLRTGTAEVSVLDGVVTVSSRNESAPASSVPVSAGMAVDYGHDRSTSAPRSADVGRIRGWQAQKIVFDDLTLAAAIEEYNRYAKTPIVLSDADLADRKVHGVFKIGEEEAFVRTLEQVLPLRATRTEREIVLAGR